MIGAKKVKFIAYPEITVTMVPWKTSDRIGIIQMNYLIHRFNRIIQRLILFFLWSGALIAALVASLWSMEIG
jgi:hypothetical protein